MRCHLMIPLAVAALTPTFAAGAAGPSVGDCLSATETSLKLRAGHKLHAARAQLLVCSAASCPADVRQVCMRRMNEVNTAVPTIVFAATGGGGQPLSAVKVTMDGAVVATVLDGSALSLDPGSHQFTFEVAGQPPVTKTLILYEGEKNRRETVVIGGPSTPPGVSSPPAGTPSTSTTMPNATATPSSDTAHTQQVGGVVVGTTGIVGIVVGSIFGALDLAAHASMQSACPDPSHCPKGSSAYSDDSKVSTYAPVSTVGFIAGGVLLAGGLTLYFTAPKREAPHVAVQLAPRGVGLTGTF